MNKPAAGAWITAAVEEIVATSPENTLHLPTGEKAFDAPLVGFSNGADPIFDQYVDHIGDFYLTPLAIFKKAFPHETNIDPAELTVISWVLPSTARVREEQAAAVTRPSERWIMLRHYGELFNESLRRSLVNRLSAAGIQAVAPVLAAFWSHVDAGPYAPCSNWSERHAAYAAGLGTFGLCDGLITPVGKAMRTGSVVARATIHPTPRSYTDQYAYCLFYSHGTCGNCIPRCPVNAISETGHDKQVCMRYTLQKMKKYSLDTYGFAVSACGICQTGVPCMAGIPHPDAG
ncbi:MAG: 4Fe-4S double cluster binding domain-containing protein [Desulfobacterales bacterium]